MAKFIIQGGQPLSGEIAVAGNKNAALPIIAATILTDARCAINNIPNIVFRITGVKNYIAIPAFAADRGPVTVIPFLIVKGVIADNIVIGVDTENVVPSMIEYVVHNQIEITVVNITIISNIQNTPPILVAARIV